MAFTFDESYYLTQYPDVAVAVSQGYFKSGYDHFAKYGAKELRSPNALFNAKEYAAANPDVLAAVSKGAFASVWDHYVSNGLNEGRAPNNDLKSFDSASYLAANPDVAAAIQGGAVKSALAHYLNYGYAEGRALSTQSTGGSAYTLTTAQDKLVGTKGNDTFTGTIFDNQNTLQSGDKVDGGAGNDRLVVDVGSSQKFAITPETTGVEEVAIRAQAIGTDGNNNNMPGTSISTPHTSDIDAQRMSGVTWWESNNSRADLIIEDVRILPSQVTKDITIAMVETDPGNVDYGVYFDQYSLRNVSTSTSTLKLELLDTRSAAAGTAPLKDNPYWGFTFKLNGATQSVFSDAIDAAQTYPELLAAVQAAIAANPALAGKVTAALGNTFTRVDTLSGATVAGTELVLTSATGGAIAVDGTTGWQTKNGTVPSSSGLHTYMTTDTTSSSELVTVKVVLDDVGRGSTGGDLVIGGLSVGDTSTSKGVERFEIEVRDNSKLQTINSTNNTLREVTIKNGETSSNSFAYVATAKNAGNLTVNGMEASNVAGDNDPLPGTAAQHNAYGFSDVRLIDASTMTGKLAFTAEVTEASIAKYLNLKDTQNAPAADNVHFVYTGGTNSDTMVVKVDSAVAASHTLSGREDFDFAINGGEGSDNITLDIGGNETGPWYVDQKLLKNISVSGGAGDDTIKTPGAGDVKIDAGAGNDTVYADNSGAINANWVIAATNTNLDDLQTSLTGTGSSFLYKGKLTVTLSAAHVGGGITSGDAVANTNGWEVTVDIPTGANYAVNQLYINQAIKNAVNNDAVLSKLLVAQDGPGYTLTIKSLIDGAFSASDLHVKVAGVDLTALPAAEQTTVLNAYKVYSANSLATIADANAAEAASVTAKNAVTGMDTHQVEVGVGTISGAESDNTIDLGAGNDVAVLGTGANSNDTVVFNGYELGKKTIVDFTEAGAAASNGDYLDFRSYLVDKASASGSVESQKAIPVTFNADASVEANSVTVLSTAAFNATDSFAGLTAAKLQAAINSTNATGSANYAGITAATLDAVTSYTASGVGTTLVGGTGHAVVLIENNLNKGEYKAFELTFTGTSANTTADFSSVREIATIDLGHSANLSASVTTRAPDVAGGTGTGGGVVVPGGSTTVNITAATAGTATNAATDNVTAVFADGNYTHTINGFGAGDKIDLPDAFFATWTLTNTSTTDGALQVQGDNGAGSVITINLVGVDLASDAAVFSKASFATTFGAGSVF